MYNFWFIDCSLVHLNAWVVSYIRDRILDALDDSLLYDLDWVIIGPFARRLI